MPLHMTQDMTLHMFYREVLDGVLAPFVYLRIHTDVYIYVHI